MGALQIWRFRRSAICFRANEVPAIHLITEYPEFKPAYEEVYRLCLNVERVMEMFSKELRELDQNTVQLMIDEMQQEINFQSQELHSQKQEIDTQRHELDSKEEIITEQADEIRKLRERIKQLETK